MSLDIRINSDIPIQKKGTGVFTRENGEIRELTVDEVIGMGWNNIVTDVADYCYWKGNITHNLVAMAKEIKPKVVDYTLYDLLWMGIDKECGSLHEKLLECISFMLRNKSYLERYNPSNGWGDYRLLLRFTIDLALGCGDNKNCSIEISK